MTTVASSVKRDDWEGRVPSRWQQQPILVDKNEVAATVGIVNFIPDMIQIQFKKAI